MQKFMIVAAAMAFIFCSPALAQHADAQGGPTKPAGAPDPKDVHPPLCVYHNITYSAGAIVCIGADYAQVCQATGAWVSLNADPRKFNACSDAKSVPPN